MGEEEARIVCYADDIVMTKTEDNLQRKLHSITQTIAQKDNMHISISYTKAMTIKTAIQTGTRIPDN